MTRLEITVSDVTLAAIDDRARKWGDDLETGRQTVILGCLLYGLGVPALDEIRERENDRNDAA